MKRLVEIFEDINGRISSKRVVGISGIITLLVLLVYVIIAAVSKEHWATVVELIQWSLLMFISLVFGGSAVEFFTKKGSKKDEKPQE